MNCVPPLLWFSLGIVSGRVHCDRRTAIGLFKAKNRMLEGTKSEATATTAPPSIDRDCKGSDKYRRLIRVSEAAAIRLSVISNLDSEFLGRTIDERCVNHGLSIGQRGPMVQRLTPYGIII